MEKEEKKEEQKKNEKKIELVSIETINFNKQSKFDPKQNNRKVNEIDESKRSMCQCNCFKIDCEIFFRIKSYSDQRNITKNNQNQRDSNKRSSFKNHSNTSKHTHKKKHRNTCITIGLMRIKKKKRLEVN